MSSDDQEEDDDIFVNLKDDDDDSQSSNKRSSATTAITNNITSSTTTAITSNTSRHNTFDEDDKIKDQNSTDDFSKNKESEFLEPNDDDHTIASSITPTKVSKEKCSEDDKSLFFEQQQELENDSKIKIGSPDDVDGTLSSIKINCLLVNHYK